MNRQTEIYQKARETFHQRLLHLDQNFAEYASNENAHVQVFENYAGLIKGLCSYMGAVNFNFYAKTSAASPNLSGILSVRGVANALGLQYIKFPIDNQTIAGHAYIQGVGLNIADLHQADTRYPDLNPKRTFVIDRKLGRQTREVLAVPVLHPTDRHVMAVIELTNAKKLLPFTDEELTELAKVAALMANSVEKGFFSVLIPLMAQTPKKSYTTTVMRDVDDEASNLSQDDIVSPHEEDEEDTQEDDEEDVAADESEDENEAEVEADRARLMREADDIKEAVSSDDEDENGNDEAEEDEADEEDDGDEGEAKTAPKKPTDPQDFLKSLRATQSPAKSEFPYEADEHQYDSAYDYLFISGVVEERELKNSVVMAESDEKMVEPFLIMRHDVTLHQLGIGRSKYLKLPYSPYDPNLPKPENLLKKLKSDFLQRMKFIPVGITEDNRIKVVSTDPIELEREGTLRQIFGASKCKVCVTTDIEFQFIYQQFFGEDASSNLDEVLASLSSQYGEGESDDFDVATAEKGVSDNELVMLVNKIISDAYTRKVSDIHIEPYPGKAKTRIRFRVDGSMMEYLTLPPTLKDAIITRIKVMANLDISDRRRPQDGKIPMKKFSTLNIELRVATIPTQGGLEDAVLRILASGEPLPLEKLGILPVNESKLIPLIEKPYGILFVCGPTGSGKTTTLHSILKHLNTVERKIWTAEDPVEITQAGLRQVQVNKKAGMDFPTTMRAFLRCDPDVIMVGEMRDHETVSMGVEASLTGHLVLSTLHTNSAPEAIVRLLDMGMDPFNFADALLGILAQRLAKKLCDNCRVEYVADDEEIDLLIQEYSLELQKTSAWVKDAAGERAKLLHEWKESYSQQGKFTLFRAGECSMCNSGYRGRIGLHELLVGSDRSKRLIQQKSTVEVLVAACLEEGMLTLKMDGIHKVLKGITDIKQVRSVCVK